MAHAQLWGVWAADSPQLRVLWDQPQCWRQGHILFPCPLANTWARQWYKGLSQWGTGQGRTPLMRNLRTRVPCWVGRDLVRPTAPSAGSPHPSLPPPFLLPDVSQGRPPEELNLQHFLTTKGLMVRVKILLKVFIEGNVIPYMVSTTFLCWKMNNRYLNICHLFDEFLSF